MSESLPAVTWRWGELFELELPEHWTGGVEREQGTVAFAPPGGTPAVQISLLDRLHGAPGDGVRAMVEGFARTQGVRRWARPVEVRLAGDLARADGQFDAAEGAWCVHVFAWEHTAVLLTAWDEVSQSEGLELADRVLSGLRPLSLTQPVALPPDPPGEF